MMLVKQAQAGRKKRRAWSFFSGHGQYLLFVTVNFTLDAPIHHYGSVWLR